METSDVRMVVFDLGGVLIRICRSWAEACALAGVDIHEGWDSAPARDHRHSLTDRYQRGLITSAQYFEGIAGTVPGLYTPDEVERVHFAWTLDEYAGVHSLIDGLHDRGIPTGILSNTNEAHWQRLYAGPHGGAEYTITAKVRHVHASHLLGESKPNEAAFRAFEKHAGISPSQRPGLLFFDDMPENIAGAQAAGWRAVQIDHAGDTAAQMLAALRAHGVD